MPPTHSEGTVKHGLRPAAWALALLPILSIGCASTSGGSGHTDVANPVQSHVVISCEYAEISAEQLTRMLARVLVEAGFSILESDWVQGIVSTDWRDARGDFEICSFDEHVPRRVRFDAKVTGSPPVIVIFPQSQYYADPVWDWCEPGQIAPLGEGLEKLLGADVRCRMRWSGDYDPETVDRFDAPPEVVHLEPPKFRIGPTRGTLQSGNVAASVLIGLDGKPRLVIPLGGGDKIRDSVLRAVMKSRFKPATRGGVPTSAWVCIPYRFSFIG